MKAIQLTAALVIAGSVLAVSGSSVSAMQQGVSYPALYAGQYQAYGNNYGRYGYMNVADQKTPDVAQKGNKATVVKKAPQRPVPYPQYGNPGYGHGGYGNGAGNGSASGNGSGNASGNGSFNMGFKGNASGNGAARNNWVGNGQGWARNYGGYNRNPWQAQVQRAPQAQGKVQQPAQPQMKMQAPNGMRPGAMQRPNMNMPTMRMNMPNMRMPNMNMPRPNMNMPNMRMPNMNMPRPNMNMPNMRMNAPAFQGNRPYGFQRPNLGYPMQYPAPQMGGTPQGAPQGQRQMNMPNQPKPLWYKRWGKENKPGQGQGWWKRFRNGGQSAQTAPSTAPQGNAANNRPQVPQFNNGYQQRPPYPQGWRQGGARPGMMAPNGGFFRQPPAPWMNQGGYVQQAPNVPAGKTKSDGKIAPEGTKKSN